MHKVLTMTLSAPTQLSVGQVTMVACAYSNTVICLHKVLTMALSARFMGNTRGLFMHEPQVGFPINHDSNGMACDYS